MPIARRLGGRAGLKPAPRLREVFGEAILDPCRRNERVVVLDGDLASTTRTNGVRDAFADRFFNIGKGNVNPLNPSATPDSVHESALGADKDPFRVASYVDGTKTVFEMVGAANATDCLPMRVRWWIRRSCNRRAETACSRPCWKPSRVPLLWRQTVGLRRGQARSISCRDRRWGAAY